MLVETLRQGLRVCPAPVRRILEKINRGRIVRRHLGREAGRRKIYATPEGSLIWALPWSTGDLDPHLNQFCQEFIQPGSVVWDFGAHFGLFAFTAAKFAGPKGSIVTGKQIGRAHV